MVPGHAFWKLCIFRERSLFTEGGGWGKCENLMHSESPAQNLCDTFLSPLGPVRWNLLICWAWPKTNFLKILSVNICQVLMGCTHFPRSRYETNISGCVRPSSNFSKTGIFLLTCFILLEDPPPRIWNGIAPRFVFSAWHGFTKVAISSLLIVRFEKFKIWHAQCSDADLSDDTMTSRATRRARWRHARAWRHYGNTPYQSDLWSHCPITRRHLHSYCN